MPRSCRVPATRLRAHFRVLLVALCCGLALGTLSCRKNQPPGASEVSGAAERGPVGPTLPALQLDDQSRDLMLTWVDAQGDFHVVERIDEVPAEAREKVRVVQVGNEAGTGQQVYIADLRSKDKNGKYAVRVAPRREWDALGAERRKARMEALAPTPEALAKANAPEQPASGKSYAIIYGADWCKPCHQAEDFLRSLGVEVTKKNIEESGAAQAEMRQKLAKVHRSGASIPVIDLNGNIMVGFNPEVLRRLVEQARPSGGGRNETL
jgi:glutaredoxin